MNKTFDLFETTESGFSDSSQATKTAINKSSERKNKKREDQYTAKDIEVLEGLEPVRKRPGMYIGGTDNQALHHLFFEVLDNAMDEVIAGYASKIDVTLNGDGSLSIRDDGRGIPIDPHPKFKDKSALEVIFTTLHSGGKFGGKAYNTSGGLHGVGISVVNALSERCEVEVARDDKVWCIVFSKGVLLEKLQPRDKKRGERGTKVTFYPDSNIFGKNNNFSPQIILKTLQDKAYLFQGVKIQWACDKSILKKHAHHNLDERALFCFPEGLKNYLQDTLKSKEVITDNFLGNVSLAENTGKIEWAQEALICLILSLCHIVMGLEL